MNNIRRATHAGSWYPASPSALNTQLEGYLTAVTQATPIRNSRIIVSPHAGYAYCGKTMAYSYASLDIVKKRKLRFFILGPSHFFYSRNECLISGFDYLETPLGNLKVDTAVRDKLLKTGNGSLFGLMEGEDDETEHSLEMQFPMLVQTLKWRGYGLEGASADADDGTLGSVKDVVVVPMLVFDNSGSVDSRLAKALAEYLEKPGDGSVGTSGGDDTDERENFFIISSDFCHWGGRFSYTGYVSKESELDEAMDGRRDISMLRAMKNKLEPDQQTISQSIEMMDRYAMKVISGRGPRGQNRFNDKSIYEDWKTYLSSTGNTICGQNPIKLILRTLTQLKEEQPAVDIGVEWLNYSQSSKVRDVRESSVSYSAGCITVDYNDV